MTGCLLRVKFKQYNESEHGRLHTFSFTTFRDVVFWCTLVPYAACSALQTHRSMWFNLMRVKQSVKSTSQGTIRQLEHIEYVIKYRCAVSLLEIYLPADWHCTPACNFHVNPQALISSFRCIWLELELNSAGWSSSSSRILACLV